VQIRLLVIAHMNGLGALAIASISVTASFLGASIAVVPPKVEYHLIMRTLQVEQTDLSLSYHG
jgi:hypothetical protein